ncbi:MAG TPA: Stp1/IreP family PP2C-type Ser/Thr phosphatase [Candidatus Acidoferrum sp.]|nr:Stp1/IreP family PP2C-type Ser/Thr phosphatase [Candidatus Acidoferrum sp.]
MPKLPSCAELQGSRGAVLTAVPQFDFGARTDMGRVRENNEDSFAVEPELSLFVLSDGMGGQASGEIASRIATETIVDYCLAAERNSLSVSQPDRLPGASDASNRLVAGVRRANSAILDATLNHPERHGMGATVVAVRFEGSRMSLAHVGDSRAYRLHCGQLEQLTRDHSFVAEQLRQGTLTQKEAEQSELQNVLLRALGQDADVEVDVTEELMLDGDAILLCSDGLTREISDEQIAVILEQADDAQAAADGLVDAANEAGGADNITVIVVRPAEKHGGAFARIGRWLKGKKES